jgi:biotin operon repressor
MKATKTEVMKKVHTILINTVERYIKAEEIADLIHRPKTFVYTIIRLLKEDGIGIYSNQEGYILAEFATRSDDVHFLRTINGKHTSSVIALNAAMPHLKERWKGLAEQNAILELAEIFNAGENNVPLLEDSRNIIDTFSRVID